MKKKETRKKERKNEKEGKEQNRNFAFDFIHCAEKPWNSRAIFYIRIAEDFHL